MKEFTDIKVVQTGPTRGRRTLDLIFTNFPQYIKEYGTLPALFNQEGVKSDHLAVHLYAKIPRVPEYQIERYTYVKHTREGDETFKQYIESTDWTQIVNEMNPDTMVERLHKVFAEAMDKSFQTITTTRKSTQPQWINQNIINLIARRRAIFRREGRSEAWKKLKKKTRSIIKKRKEIFNKKKREKIIAADSRSFHQAVKSIISDEKKKPWTPTQMFPTLSPVQVAEKCADFFNGISSEYEPLRKTDIPETFKAEQLVITPKIVEQEILKGKKPKSRVPGDIFVQTLVMNIKTLPLSSQPYIIESSKHRYGQPNG